MRATLLTTAAAVLLSAGAAAGPIDECSALTASRVETSACLKQRANGVDKALASIMSRAREGAKRLEAEADAAAGALKRLEESAAAFKAYRKAACDEAIPPMFAGGTGTGDAVLACRIRLGRERIEALRRNYPG